MKCARFMVHQGDIQIFIKKKLIRMISVNYYQKDIFSSSGHESLKNDEDVLVTYFGPGCVILFKILEIFHQIIGTFLQDLKTKSNLKSSKQVNFIHFRNSKI